MIYAIRGDIRDRSDMEAAASWAAAGWKKQGREAFMGPNQTRYTRESFIQLATNDPTPS
jgi:hypothetical protein